jgi:hypothetical protein
MNSLALVSVIAVLAIPAVAKPSEWEPPKSHPITS